MTTLLNRRILGGSLGRAATLCLLALAAVLAQPGEARAQWTTSGTTTSTSGNVGVGTAAPQASLHVTTGTTGTRGIINEQTSADNNSALYIFRKSRAGAAAANGDNIGNLYASAFDGTSFVSGGRLRFAIDGPVAAGSVPTALQFFTGNSADGVERMRIGSNGNVGIGAESPAAKLHVQSDSTYNNEGSPALILGSKSNPTYRLLGGYDLNVNAAFLQSLQSGLGYRTLGINPNGGFVGVGTVAPAAPLEVKGQTNGATLLKLFDASTNATASAPKIVFNAGGTDIANIKANYNGGAFRLDLGATDGAQAVSILNSGRVGIGTTAPASALHVNGDITVSGNINAKYQDVAEWVPSTQKLNAGTVVVLNAGRGNHVLASAGAYDTRVAGVVSAQPGIALGERGEGKVLVATTGRVKVRVDATRAPIQIGDLIVTSDAEGVAMKSQPVSVGGVQMHRPGTLIGKALESLEKGTGEILVLLSLQ